LGDACNSSPDLPEWEMMSIRRNAAMTSILHHAAARCTRNSRTTTKSIPLGAARVRAHGLATAKTQMVAITARPGIAVADHLRTLEGGSEMTVITAAQAPPAEEKTTGVRHYGVHRSGGLSQRKARAKS
jgi:hypothetical protein